MLFRLFVSVDIIFIYASPLFLSPYSLSMSFYSILLLIDEVLFLFFKKIRFIFITLLELQWVCTELEWVYYVYVEFTFFESYFLKLIPSLFLLSRSISHTHTSTWFNSYFFYIVSSRCLFLSLSLTSNNKGKSSFHFNWFDCSDEIHNINKNQPVAKIRFFRRILRFVLFSFLFSSRFFFWMVKKTCNFTWARVSYLISDVTWFTPTTTMTTMKTATKNQYTNTHFKMCEHLAQTDV